jgi:5-methyltetrahydrofolate corrinoid/iron sulfur protein methyltransferase
MIAIGERINGMFKDVKKAIRAKDASVIKDLAVRQTEAGAAYLDINVGTAAEDQLAAMRWLVQTVQSACKTPITLDSQKLDVIKAGLEVVDGRPIMINSSNGAPEKLDVYVPLAAQHNASLIALAMDARGVPQNVETRVEIAGVIAMKAMEHGLDMQKLFIDPIILPINVDQKQPGFLLDVFSQIRMLSDPAPHMTVGLTNLSQMASEREMRQLINRTFIVMAIAAGLDSAICDVFDTALMDAAITAEMVLNRQIYSDSFLKAARM